MHTLSEVEESQGFPPYGPAFGSNALPFGEFLKRSLR